MRSLAYVPLERIAVRRPVHRVPYIAERCRDRVVLDLGCLDATALVKRDTGAWLHGAIARTARQVLGVDQAADIPDAGIVTGPRSRIVRGDVTAWLRDDQRAIRAPDGAPIDTVVAGELIEHLPDTLGFFETVRERFPGKALLCSTPNATALHNVALAAWRRESAHPDHLQVYSYKTLATLCRRAGFAAWEIVPYHVSFAEMRLRNGGFSGTLIAAAERASNAVEWLLPLYAGGLILDVARI